MKKLSMTAAILTLLFALITSSTGITEETGATIEELKRHIFDFANLLPDDQRWLEKDLQKESVGIVIVTIPSLEGSLAKKHTHAVNKAWDTKKKNSSTITIIFSAEENTLEITRTGDTEKRFNWTNIQSEVMNIVPSLQVPSEIITAALDIIRNNVITPDDPYGGDTTEPLNQKPDLTPEIERPVPFPPLEDEGEIEPVRFQPEGQEI